MSVNETFRKVFEIIQNKKFSQKFSFIRFIGRLKMYAINSVLTTLGIVRPRERYDAFFDKLYIFESSLKGKFIFDEKGVWKKFSLRVIDLQKNIVHFCKMIIPFVSKL